MLQPQVTETLTRSSKFIFVPTSEEEYEGLVGLLDELTDIVRDDEAHPLAKTMDVIGVLIAEYEDEHIPELIRSLKFPMNLNSVQGLCGELTRK